MDIYCKRCGEPWDNDELHDRVEELRYDGRTTTPIDGTSPLNYDTLAAEFRRHGCEVFGSGPCTKVESDRTLAAQAMYEVCGDDMDGASAMLDDLFL